MSDPFIRQVTVFDRFERIATGTIIDVIPAAKKRVDNDYGASVLIFDDRTGEVIDVDLRGSLEDVLHIFRQRTFLNENTKKLIAELSSGSPGATGTKSSLTERPVTLLPRHWEWLDSQPGGASVALRKLVEQARRDVDGKDKVRQSQEAAYRFLSALAGDLPGYEEALRALFAGERIHFAAVVSQWPQDTALYAADLAADALRERPLPPATQPE